MKNRTILVAGEQWTVRVNGPEPTFMASGGALAEPTHELILFENKDGTKVREKRLPIGKFDTLSDEALKRLFNEPNRDA